MTTSDGRGALIATLRIAGHGDHEMHGPVTIGRDPRADDGAMIEVDGDPLVSKSHLCIDIDQADLIITDLGSSNGTFLHHAAGETAVPSDRWIPIPAGAEIEFGDQRMTIERASSADPEATIPSTPTPSVGSHDEAADNAATIEHVVPVAQPVAPISGSFWADQTDAVPAAAPVDPPVSAPAPSPSPSRASPAPAPVVDEGAPCVQCHRDLPPGSKFCDGCGAPVMPERAPAPTPTPASTPSADDAGHTVVIPPGGFAPGLGQPAASPGVPPAQPAPQYGGPVAGAIQQGLPGGQFGQSPHPPGVAGPAPTYLGAPGQPAGGPVFVDPNATASSKGGAGKKILLGLGVVVVLGLIVFALVAVLGGDDDSAGGFGFELDPVSTEIDELWSSDVDDATGFAEIGETSVYVESELPEARMLTSLERETGDERWSVSFDDADFVGLAGEFDDITVVSPCVFGDDGGTTCDAVGLDRADGDEIWRESIDDGTAFASGAGVLVAAENGLTLLDPATGERLERVRGDVTFGSRDTFLLDDDGEVSAYDDELQPLIGPVEVNDEAGAVAFDGDRLLVAVGDEVEFVDSSGDVTTGPRLDGDITRLVSIDSSTVVAELGDQVVAYDLDGDEAIERWSEGGTLFEVSDPDGGAVVIVDTDDDTLIIDLESGDDRFAVDGDSVLIPASNALVTIEGFDPERFTAFDWVTGDEIWSDEFDGSGNVAGIVVVIETDGDVVAYG